MIALGLLLLASGGALLVAEAHVPSHGVFGILGVGGIGAGLALMLSAAGVGLAVVLVVTVLAAVAAAGMLAIALPHAAATRHTRVRSGAEGMIGRIGVVRGGDCVFVGGALWKALPDNGQALEEGDHVVVEGVTGLTLSVRKAEELEVPR